MRSKDLVRQAIGGAATITLEPTHPPFNPIQRAEEFLATVSNRYIAAMRNALPTAGEVLYGGDVELIEIAQLLNIRIIVNRHLGYSFQQGLMVEPQLAIGPRRSPIIQLLLAGRHYQICLQLPSGEMRIINVPGDGNCLFHACIRAKKLLEAGSDDLAVAISTLEEVAILRGQVCDRLQIRQAAIARGDSEEREDFEGRARLTQDDDPIRSRFAAVLQAEDQEQLYLATDALPGGSLLAEAKAIKHVLSPGLRFSRRLAAKKLKAPTKQPVSKSQAEQEPRSSQSSIVQQVDLVPTVVPLSSTSKVVAKPLKLDPAAIAMRRNTTLPKATNGIDFRVERVVGDTLGFRVSIIRQLGDKIEELTNVIEAGREVSIPVLPKAGVQVEIDGTFHLVGDWPWDFNYEFALDSDICIDELNSTGKIKINARRLKSHSPVQAKELELHVTEELAIPELSVNASVVICYEGEQAHYHCGPIISRGTVEITCPNCNLEQASNIDASGAVNLTAQEVITNGAAITSFAGDLQLTATRRDSPYTIINRGTLQAEWRVKFTGQGFRQEGVLAANSDFIFEVINLRLQQKIACGGSIDCELPGEFVQAVGASITVCGTFKLRVARSIQTWAPIEANGKLTVVIADDAPSAILETNGELISHSVEGLEIRVPSFINNGIWQTTRGGMLVMTSILPSAEVNRNLGSISCVGDFCIDTTELLLERGSFKTNGNFLINSPSLRLVITSPCEVGGDLRASNILAGDFVYSADAIKVAGILGLKFTGDCLTVLESAINTPGNIEIEVATGSNKLLRLAAPIKANGWIKLIAPEIETTSTLEARGTIELASTATSKTYTITNTGTIRTAAGHITIHGQGLSHTAGTIASNADLVIAVQHANLIRPCTAVGKLEVTVPQTFIYTADTFIAGSVEIIRANGFAITAPLNNPGGSLVLTIQAGTVADVQVQAPVKASGGVKIVTPTRLVVGQSGTLQEITAGGLLHLEAGVIDNSWGKLFGQGGVYLRAAGDILNGMAAVAKKLYALVPRISFEDDFHASNGALITSGGAMQVVGTALQNIHGEIYVAGNLDTLLTPKLLNLGGVITIGGNTDFSKTEVENRMVFDSINILVKVPGTISTRQFGMMIVNYPISQAPTIKIADCTVFNVLNNYSGNIYVVGSVKYLNVVGIHNSPLITKYHIPERGQSLIPLAKPMIAVTLQERQNDKDPSSWLFNYFCHIFGQNYSSNCPVCCEQPLETHQGTISSGKAITITPKTLTLLGTVSSPHIEITGFSSAIIGVHDASIQLVPAKPFQQVHRLIDYARPSGLFRVAGSASPTIMELTIPLQYEPNLKPAVVITPIGFSLNYKNLKLLYPPFAERQYITEILMSELKRGYLDEKCTTPEQIHYKLRCEAFHVYEQFTNKSGGGVATLPEKLARANVTEPVLIYQEIEYAGPNGKETVLSPVVWFPKYYDNPYARNGMGLMYGNQIYILGDLEKGSSLYIGGCIQATQTLAAACRDKFTLSGIVQGGSETLASFEDNVEVVSRFTRVHRSNGYDDVISRARAEARDTLAIAAPKKDVVFQGAETHSGVRTDIQAGRSVLDFSLPLTHHSIQYVHDDCYGIITDTHIEQCVSKHSSGDVVATGAITMEAGDSARLYAPEFDSHTAEIASRTGISEVLDVTESHQHEAHLTEESSRWFGSDKEIHAVSVSEISKGPQFRVKSLLVIAGESGVRVRHFRSAADVTRFKAPTATVSIEQGPNRSQSFYSSHRSNALWQSSEVEQSLHVTHSPSTFAGRVEIDAGTLNLELVRGNTLEFLSRLATNGARVTHTVVDEVHHHESESHSGPSVGLAALTSIAVGILTAGSGTAATLAAKASTEIGSKMIIAGFSAACAQASVALLSNKGDPFKAIETLGKEESIKAIATSMLSAGIMHKICGKLKLPKVFAKKTPIQHLQYNLARASVSAVLNMSINEENPGKAILEGLADAAVSTAAGITTQGIGELYTPGKETIDYLTHKMLHIATGAITGLALKGKKGVLPGAIGAGVAEIVAEGLFSEIPIDEQVEAAELEKDRKLTPEEYYEIREAAIRERAPAIAISKSADYAKIAAASAAFLAQQDVSLAAGTATTAVENNFTVSTMAAMLMQQDYLHYLEKSKKLAEEEVVEVEQGDALEQQETPGYIGVNLGELPPTYSLQQKISLAKRAFMGDGSPEVLAWQQHNRSHAPSIAASFYAAIEMRERINKPIADFKDGLQRPIVTTKQQNVRKLEALDLSGIERFSLHTANVGLTAASFGIDLFVPGSMDQIGADLLVTAAGIKTVQVAHRIAEARRIGRSLGANPFKNKTFGQIDSRLRKEGFRTVGKNPAGGEGAYFHPGSGRKYYLDEGGDIYVEGKELSHVDVHRKNLVTGNSVEKRHQLPEGTKLKEPKRKYPLGDQLLDPTIKPPTQSPNPKY